MIQPIPVLSIMHKLQDPQVRQTIYWTIIGVLYLTGRLRKSQFKAEQVGAKDAIPSSVKKIIAVEQTTYPLTVIFDMLNQLPVINVKIPIINASLPDIGKGLIQVPVGVLSDFLHNAPFIGSKVDKP